MDVASLAELLKETAERHGSFEEVAPAHDWWDWYAAYMDARESGSSADEADGRRSLHGGGQAAWCRGPRTPPTACLRYSRPPGPRPSASSP